MAKKFEPFNSPRVDVKAFIDSIRPRDPEYLTPAELQPFLLFLLVDSEKIQGLITEARENSAGLQDFELTVSQQLNSIEDDLRKYQSRLDLYLASVNTEIELGVGDSSEFGAYVARPLFLGLYGKTMKLPTGDGSPLCKYVESCYRRTPDLANAVILRNQLASFVDFDEEQWGRFFQDLNESAGHLVEETFHQVAKAARGEIPAWKWALGGAIGVVFLAGVYRLVK